MRTTTHQYTGGCHCGNVTLTMAMTGAPDTYNPRACDCGYCRRHAAAYVSDARGKLDIVVAHAANLSKYRQGSRIADCLVCRICGVLVGISYAQDDVLYAAVNRRVVGNGVRFGADIAASPSTLKHEEKILRWKKIWFSDVRIKILKV